MARILPGGSVSMLPQNILNIASHKSVFLAFYARNVPIKYVKYLLDYMLARQVRRALLKSTPEIFEILDMECTLGSPSTKTPAMYATLQAS